MATISKSTLTFLANLKKNNDRDWFNQNRKDYELAKKEFEIFVQAAIDQIAVFEPIMKGLEASSCIFRINRDVRFSNDKSPYKAHFGAFIVKGGRKNGDKYGGYYIHIEPGNNLLAGGAHMPPSPWLAALREKIDEDPKKLLKIINDKEFITYFGKLEGEKLKSAPRGYPADHPYLDLLKYKSYFVMAEVADKDVISHNYLNYVIKVSKAMKPLNDFVSEY